ncbi:hypothetical protein AB4Y45_35465 [Paraburkholderia sp. EG287A]|uniref:hypothetical protein n=1 Tax=Paraburkholderia sp. EG287A TaxID=3237012 RepID=UPI0034D22F02
MALLCRGIARARNSCQVGHHAGELSAAPTGNIGCFSRNISSNAVYVKCARSGNKLHWRFNKYSAILRVIQVTSPEKEFAVAQSVIDHEQMEAKRKAALALLETQQRRLEGLNARRQKIQVTVEAARQQYEQAVQESTSEHKTADLDQLRSTLVSLEAENANVLAQFVQAVDKYEAFIVRIETAMNDPEAMSALIASLEAAGAALADTEAEPAAATAPAAAAAPVFDENDI